MVRKLIKKNFKRRYKATFKESVLIIAFLFCCFSSRLFYFRSFSFKAVATHFWFLVLTETFQWARRFCMILFKPICFLSQTIVSSVILSIIQTCRGLTVAGVLITNARDLLHAISCTIWNLVVSNVIGIIYPFKCLRNLAKKFGKHCFNKERVCANGVYKTTCPKFEEKFPFLTFFRKGGGWADDCL